MGRKPTAPQPNSEPEWLLPYELMGVGDSFFIPTMRPSYMLYIVENTSKKVGVEVKAFPRHEKGVLGVRVWRVA